jgi:hypothetical protein
MSDEVKFEEDSFNSSTSALYGKFVPSSTVPMMVQWIINLGLAKTSVQANYILLGIATAMALLSLYFFFGFGPPTSTDSGGPPWRSVNTQGF